MKIDYDKAKEITKDASMTEQPKSKKSTNKKIGRPKKIGESATSKIMINVTPSQKKKIQKYADSNNSTIAGLIKGLLTKEEII